jgi:ATP-dependent DNA helicase RecQ
LQGAVRLIRRADVGIEVNGKRYGNPVLNLLNIFSILFLGQQENEMLETELYNDYKDVMRLYYSEGKLNLLDEFTDLLIQHTAIPSEGRDYIEKIQLAVQLDMHLADLKTINQKYRES